MLRLMEQKAFEVNNAYGATVEHMTVHVMSKCLAQLEKGIFNVYY